MSDVCILNSKFGEYRVACVAGIENIYPKGNNNLHLCYQVVFFGKSPVFKNLRKADEYAAKLYTDLQIEDNPPKGIVEYWVGNDFPSIPVEDAKQQLAMGVPKINQILVVKHENDRYSLRIHLQTRNGEVIRFETQPEFSKPEADYRAILVSAAYGFTRDELPSWDFVMPYPKD